MNSPMPTAYSSPMLPSVSPLRARLLNALISRALPVSFAVDAGREPAPQCRLDVNGTLAALESPAPFSVGATLYLLAGDAFWKIECASLAAVALRPELAAWRAETGQDFSSLPPGLSLAVLERLFAPAVDSLALWLGCEACFASAPRSEPEWSEPLPLILTLPEGENVSLRLFWAEERAARFVLERLEAAPPRAVDRPAGCAAAALVQCHVEIGGLSLAVKEARELALGDVLLPEYWTPGNPRLRLPGGTALECRLENGLVSILGKGRDRANEVLMTEEAAPVTAVESPAEGGDVRLLDEETLAGMELPVVFELAALSIRVDEAAALAPGHTFALGGDVASIPVFVRVGGRLAAKGRLVDVGGMPGVQITGLVAPAEAERTAQE